MAGARGERAGLAPAGHATVDQARIARQTFVRPEAEALHDAGAEALDQHVSAFNQFENEGLCLQVLEVNIPLTKIFFQCRLLLGVLQGEDAFLVIGGVIGMTLSTI